MSSDMPALVLSIQASGGQRPLALTIYAESLICDARVDSLQDLWIEDDISREDISPWITEISLLHTRVSNGIISTHLHSHDPS